ncbi:MAG: APC family permease [Oligoflexia bacterium]|nr:APC family permease [Oligoflexia bacterium]
MPFSLKKLIVGQPIASDRAAQERLSKKKALAIFSSDALSSTAYATEEILRVLVPAVAMVQYAHWSVPIAICIVGLLWILILSYRQTITAYPNGGGAYSVSKENLGTRLGLVAGAALIIDYILTVAVSVAAGAAAVTSAFPSMLEHGVLIANIAIIVLMLINLRGIRESGNIFAVPTYIFVFSLLTLFAFLFIAPSPNAVKSTYSLFPHAGEDISWWIIFVAFASGCTALTGVEAISNGVQAFKKPEQENAKKTLVLMGCILAVLFFGITYFANTFSIVPKDTETVVSQLARLSGSNILYYIIQAATAGILFLAANTSFNGFPQVASLLADDRFLPRQFASRGDRLVFSNAIVGLGFISMFLVWLFNANVHHLIPLYAIGVFLSFSLAQAGMVKHWLKTKEHGWQKGIVINIIGLIATAVVLVIIVATKFTHGGFLVVFMIPLLVFEFQRIKRHYLIVGDQLRIEGPPPAVDMPASHHVIVPVSGIHRGVIEALHYARSISGDITACYIDITPRITQRIAAEWERYGMGIPLKILASPYRSVIKPLLDFVEEECLRVPDGMITVIIPEFVTAKWWQNLLHNQTAIVIKAALAFKPRVVVTSVRYHLSKG